MTVEMKFLGSWAEENQDLILPSAKRFEGEVKPGLTLIIDSYDNGAEIAYGTTTAFQDRPINPFLVRYELLKDGGTAVITERGEPVLEIRHIPHELPTVVGSR